jgi:hypothetical protein
VRNGKAAVDQLPTVFSAGHESAWAILRFGKEYPQTMPGIGDYVEEFPCWAPRLANCRAFIAAANAAGGKAELLVLPEIGIRGNTHMLMQDDNSLDIADILIDWIGKHVSTVMQ